MRHFQLSIVKIGTLLVLGTLAACGDNEKPLTGERFSIRPADVSAPVSQTAAIRLPAQRSNAEWSHLNGAADHSFGHAAFSASPSLRWSTDIGAGVSRDARISSGPVAANGVVFAMDGRGQVSAVGSDGVILWSQDTSPANESRQASSGGGVSYSNGVIYAATGFGEVLAIDAASGAIIWRRAFAAPIHAAPTISGNRLYLVTRGDVAYSLRTDDGAMEWLQRGAVATIGGIEGGASPAVSGSRVILPFSSGDLMSASTGNGQLKWREAMDGVRRSTALGFIGDISGDPVIDGNKLYVSILAGQTVQMNLSTGAKNWSLAVGATDAVWPVGGSIFLISEQATMMRVNASNGSVIWSQQLPAFENPEKHKGAIRYYGPVLAGGLMWIAGRDGQLRGFTPEDGNQVVTLNVPNGAAAAPIVAGGVMYVLSLNGELHAFQ